MTRLSSLTYGPLLLLSALAPSIVHSQQTLHVSSLDGLIWVHASNVTARTLAEELSSQLNINVVLTGDSETRLDIDIAEEPLASAVSKMSPNNLVVRETDDPNSEIIEVVLMMGDESVASGDDTSQFLPSGSLGEEIVSGDYANQIIEAQDPASLRDPGRTLRVRQTANAASSDASLSPVQPQTEYPNDAVDPPSALPLDQQQ